MPTDPPKPETGLIKPPPVNGNDIVLMRPPPGVAAVQLAEPSTSARPVSTPPTPTKPAIQDGPDGRLILRLPRPTPKSSAGETPEQSDPPKPDALLPTIDECKQAGALLPTTEEVIDDRESVRTLDDDGRHRWCYVCNDDKQERLEEEKGICKTCPRVFHKSCTVPKLRVAWSEDENWQCIFCKIAPIKTEDESKTLMTPRNRYLCQRVLMKCFGTRRASYLMISWADPEKTLEIVGYRLEEDHPMSFETVDEFIEALNGVLITASIYNSAASEKGKGTQKVWMLYRKAVKDYLPEFVGKVWSYIPLYGFSLNESILEPATSSTIGSAPTSSSDNKMPKRKRALDIVQAENVETKKKATDELEPQTIGWFDIPFEMREMIMELMDLKMKGKMLRCSKDCAKEVKRMKNFISKIRLLLSSNKVCVHLTFGGEYSINIDIKKRSDKIIVVYDSPNHSYSSRTISGDFEEFAMKRIKAWINNSVNLEQLEIHLDDFPMSDFNINNLIKLKLIMINSETQFDDLLNTGIIEKDQFWSIENIMLVNVKMSVEQLYMVKSSSLQMRNSGLSPENLNHFVKSWKNGEIHKKFAKMEVKINDGRRDREILRAIHKDCNAIGEHKKHDSIWARIINTRNECAEISYSYSSFTMICNSHRDKFVYREFHMEDDFDTANYYGSDENNGVQTGSDSEEDD